MGGLEFGVNQPADSSAALDQPPKGTTALPSLSTDASQTCIKIRFTRSPSPEPQLGLGLQPIGKPCRREEARSHTNHEGIPSLLPHVPK